MRFAQLPPLDTMTMGAPGGEQAPAAPAFKIIYSPLDSLAKILADLDFKSFLENNFGTEAGELAEKIWVMYGGNENDLEETKKGRRQDKPSSDDMMQQQEAQEDEYNRTRKTRWERLPEGVGIDDITTTEAIEQAIIGGYKALTAPQQKPASAERWLKMASVADDKGDFYYSDKLMNLINYVYTPK